MCKKHEAVVNRGSDLGEVSVLGGLDGVLGDVVPEYDARVGAVHHPHPLLPHGRRVALAFQLPSQTLPAAVITRNSQRVTVTQAMADSAAHFLPCLSVRLLPPFISHTSTQKVSYPVRAVPPPSDVVVHVRCVSRSTTSLILPPLEISPIACDPAAPVLRLLGLQLLLARLHQVFQFAESVQLPRDCRPVRDHLEQRRVALSHREQHRQLPVDSRQKS